MPAGAARVPAGSRDSVDGVDVRTSETSTPGPVDWQSAAAVAGRLSRPGPTASRQELVDLVAGLRDAADRAVGHAARITELRRADGTDPAERPVSVVHVVDRPSWARANTQLLEALTAGVPVPLPAAGSAAVRYAGAAQIGGVLALLSGRVLGQFDPFTVTPGRPGRLLVVAPNVLQVERALEVDPDDFRLWVALHEQTHALQFAAAPWLADHLRERARVLLHDLGSEQGGTWRPATPELGRIVSTVVKALRDPEGSTGMLDLLTVEQRRVFEEVGAVMALLEGHADVAMDAVGPSVVPSVRDIRSRFEARRDANARAGGADRVLRRLLGLDAKLVQYRDGAAFVKAVRRAVKTEGLNAVWADPSHLPTPREIADPRAWVRRVHG